MSFGWTKDYIPFSTQLPFNKMMKWPNFFQNLTFIPKAKNSSVRPYIYMNKKWCELQKLWVWSTTIGMRYQMQFREHSQILLLHHYLNLLMCLESYLSCTFWFGHRKGAFQSGQLIPGTDFALPSRCPDSWPALCRFLPRAGCKNWAQQESKHQYLASQFAVSNFQHGTNFLQGFWVK